MPDKSYNSRCGKSCQRCWRNKLKHGNKLKTPQFPKQNVWDQVESSIDTSVESEEEHFSSVQNYITSKLKPYSWSEMERKDKLGVSLFTLYENYREWAWGENTYLLKRKQFQKELRQHLKNCYIENDTYKLTILE